MNEVQKGIIDRTLAYKPGTPSIRLAERCEMELSEVQEYRATFKYYRVSAENWSKVFEQIDPDLRDLFERQL